MQILLIFGLAIAFLAILFAIQNTEVVSISFLFWETEGSLALILFIALAAGALITYLVTAPGQVRRRMNISSQRKQITDLERQLSDTQEENAQLKGEMAQVEAAQKEGISPIADTEQVETEDGDQE
jgi:putative membrane protein